MLYFSIRKRWHALKLFTLLVLVLMTYKQWRGPVISEEEEYERQILDDEARIIPGLGEGGDSAYLSGVDMEYGEASKKEYGMNVYLSDRIAYNRSLNDHRNPSCVRVLYDAELPSASVILIFHNEPYSVLLRTIWSVLNSARRAQPWFLQAYYKNMGEKMKLGFPGQNQSSPFVYLKEIILVDDNSTLPELKGKLSHYVRTRLPPDLIKILRLPDRLGLTRAKHYGVRKATGDVLIFLDCHCEANHDWLRPLLQRIKQKRTTVVTPVMNVISATDFSYDSGDPMTFEVGGFTFSGYFTWSDVPEGENENGMIISPIRSPTMAGGLFAMSREYYWELGAYDEQMAGWGGENLEMSFRIWQCGGTLETIPCSLVGHVFSPKNSDARSAANDTHGINTARMAEVWMDEYAELFYLHRPDLRNNTVIGDLTQRRLLRKELACESFQWYLDNIYKEKFVPVCDVYGYGRFKNPTTNMCLESLNRDSVGLSLGVFRCLEPLEPTQYLSLTLTGQLRSEFDCAHLQPFNASTRVPRILMSNCRLKQHRDIWLYLPTKQLQHVASKLCVDFGYEFGADVVAKPCNIHARTQKWLVDYTEENDFRSADQVIPRDVEEILRQIRRRRRSGD